MKTESKINPHLTAHPPRLSLLRHYFNTGLFPMHKIKFFKFNTIQYETFSVTEALYEYAYWLQIITF